MKNKISMFIARLTTLAMIATSVFNFAPVRAAAMTSASDTMTRVAELTTADHTIVATLPTGVTFDAADEMSYTWAPAFTSGGTWAAADFTFNDGGGAVSIDGVLAGASGAPATCSGAVDAVTVGIDTDNGNMRVLACDGYVTSGSAATITFTIDGTIGDGTLTNPAAGPATLTIGHGDEAAGNDDVVLVGLSIVDSDQVTVTASIDPSITFDLDTYTAANTTAESGAPYDVPLGTLSASAVATSGDSDTDNGIKKIGLDLGTNGTGGAVVTVQNTNGADGLESASVPTDTIPAVSSTTLVAGTLGYGLCINYVKAGASDPVGTFRAAGGTAFGGALSATSTTGADGATTSTTCTDTAHVITTGLDGTAQNILDTSGDVVSAARALVLVKAAISATTPAHNDYTDKLTFVATATF